MLRAIVPGGLLLALSWVLAERGACAQGPMLPEIRTEQPGSERSSLGSPPGAVGGGFGTSPGSTEEILGGRPGTSVPRVPPAITRPETELFGREEPGIVPPPSLPITEVPLYGPLALPSGREDEGPPDGLTLDMAIERLVRENLGLRSRFYEIPQAQADILTASLRANPLLYADSQLIPYEQYSNRRPGGPLQYDLNITYPLDVTHKRQARTEVASRAKRVLEAQYQDAVRLQIDNLYTSYIDVLAARETIRFAQASRTGLSILLDRNRRMYERGSRTLADVSRMQALFDAAEVGLMDAEETLRRAKRNLGVLLGIPPARAETLELRGTIYDVAPPPPPIEQLIPQALESRPDLQAFRLGIRRAEAEVRLARANRLSDVFLLYQPYTFQNNAPFGQQSATSWALGVTVPLPVYNRNQGNIQRAKLNVVQTEIEASDLELQVTNEVRQAEREYQITRAAVERIERTLIPSVRVVLDHAYRLYTQGEEAAIVYLNAQRDYNEAVRQYRDMVIRHRRSMLRLNTALGRRILP